MDEDLVRKYEKRVKNLEPLLIGKTAVELIIPDTTQSDDFTRWYSSYGFSKPYVILWFYDPDCPTCTKETMKMKVLYDSLERAGSVLDIAELRRKRYQPLENIQRKKVLA